MSTFPFPDAAPDAEALGAPAPGGVEMFGGADLIAATDAHGYTYVVYCGERAGRTFGTYCFRLPPAGPPEWVELPAFTEGRAGATLEPSGLWLAWPDPGGRSFTRIRVPGFVTPGYPSSGQAAPAPLPVPSTPAPGSVSTVDAEARAYTAKVKKDLERRIKALEDRPAAAGLTPQQVLDLIWSKLPDALYALLASDNAGIVGQLRRIVGK